MRRRCKIARNHRARSNSRPRAKSRTESPALIAVIGAGSWGTALAVQFARTGHPTVLWGRDEDQVHAMAAERRNTHYLPDVPFPRPLAVTASLAEALRGAPDVLVAVPSHTFRKTLESIAALGLPLQGLAWATKGFEQQSGLLPHQVAEQALSADLPTAALAGPTFAAEVGAGLPSAMTIASAHEAYALRLAESISSDTFRAYTSSDIIGVEVGGATKNVYAIGAGLSDGLGFGSNTRIALLTRGLAEMTRLGLALGASMETFMGLAGVGDLVLTCTDDQSRNRRFGLALARGDSVDQARRRIGQVVEGYYAALAVRDVAAKLGVDMPIVEQIYRVLYEQASPKEAVTALMRRPIMAEKV
jgi:glycerol-3-phosphate dehydrogenase (NAD(P)+)